MENSQNKLIGIGIIAIIAVIILSTVAIIVPETKQAVIVRYGDPVRTLNQYQDKQTFGRTGAGLHFRIPIAEEVIWVDKQILDITMELQPVLSTDQLRLEVDAYARYRIIDPQLMYIKSGTVDSVSATLKSLLGSSLRNELGKRTFASLLSVERAGIVDKIQSRLNNIASQYGVRIVDVQIKRADLPEGTPLESAYQRMRTAREQEARSIRAQGDKEARIIRADADATAARTYAEAFGKDAGFYEFYRAMQSYERSFLTGDADTSILLSPENEYLRQFQGR